jgi:hypothetical protein
MESVLYCYNIVLGDFNCILDKKIDRYPNRRTDDIGKIELQNLITPVLSKKLKLISKAKCLLKRIATPFDSLDPHNHALAPPPCVFHSLFHPTMKMIVSIITILFWEILIVFSIKRLIDIPID